MSGDDARFEDGAEAPLRLQALDGGDLDVVSSLVQDAVFPVTEMSWLPGKRRFALLLYRFRWEDAPQAKRLGRRVERVQAVLSIDNVTRVQSRGITRSDPDLILSLLSIRLTETPDGGERIDLTLAGDGEIALHVTAIDVGLRDVTRPYHAPSGQTPAHPDT